MTKLFCIFASPLPSQNYSLIYASSWRNVVEGFCTCSNNLIWIISTQNPLLHSFLPIKSLTKYFNYYFNTEIWHCLKWQASKIGLGLVSPLENSPTFNLISIINNYINHTLKVIQNCDFEEREVIHRNSRNDKWKNKFFSYWNGIVLNWVSLLSFFSFNSVII